MFQRLLGDGSNFGISLTYKTQDKPRGLADAFIVGEDFIGSDDVCLILGDNIFYGQGFVSKLLAAKELKKTQQSLVIMLIIQKILALSSLTQMAM